MIRRYVALRPFGRAWGGMKNMVFVPAGIYFVPCSNLPISCAHPRIQSLESSPSLSLGYSSATHVSVLTTAFAAKKASWGLVVSGTVMVEGEKPVALLMMRPGGLVLDPSIGTWRSRRLSCHQVLSGWCFRGDVVSGVVLGFVV